MMKQDDQDLVAAVLQTMPPPEVRGDFVARVNARIDAAAGWLGLADFRLWTLRLAPAALALALVAIFWTTPSSPATSSSTVTAASSTAASSFSPASSSDWQTEVSGDALIEAALSPRGGTSVR
jgi:hypothetical protein